MSQPDLYYLSIWQVDECQVFHSALAVFVRLLRPIAMEIDPTSKLGPFYGQIRSAAI